MRANMRVVVIVAAGFFLAFFSAGFAATGSALLEGRGELVFGTGANQPLTITQPGTYVLTEDIVVDTPPAIIVAASPVTIDLAGHTVGTPGFDNGTIVRLDAGSHQLGLAHGTISGGGACIGSAEVGSALAAHQIQCIGSASGIALDASGLAVENSSFSTEREAIHVSGSYSVRLVGNTIATTSTSSDAVVLAGIRRGLIALNAVSSSTYDGTLLKLDALGSARVEYNTLTAELAKVGVSLGTGTFSLTGNTITGTRDSAILALSSGNRLAHNHLSHGAAPGDAVTLVGADNAVVSNIIEDYSCGIRVLGAMNGIAGNTVSGSWDTAVTVSGTDNTLAANRLSSDVAHVTVGLLLDATSADNRYKNNAFSGNPGGDLIDDGQGNVDAGGNTYEGFPGQRNE